MIRLIESGLGALILTLLITPVCRWLAQRLGIVAHPRDDRWHRKSVALLGGVALYLGWVLTVLALGLYRTPFVPHLLLGATALVVVGIIDDIRPLGAQTKLIGQVLVAAAMATLGLQLRLTHMPFLDLLITLFWIVAVTNAFNLLDNMDGLAAGVAAIAAGFRLVFFLMDGNVEGAALSAALGAVALGFLVYNFNPASIFMGDAGSLFLGFTVSGLSLIGGYPYSRGTLSVLLFPALVLLVPIFDTTLVTVARVLAGRRISQGGQDHTSHRLVALGLSERRAVVLMYLVAFASGTVSLLSYWFGLSYTIVAIGLMLVGLSLFAVLIGRLKVYPEEERPASDTAGLVRLLTDFPHKRQVATVIVDFALVVLAYYAAHLLRYEELFRPIEPWFVRSLPIVIACQMLTLALFRTYQGAWRYTSLNDLARLGLAAMTATMVAIAVLFVTLGIRGQSRAVFILDALLLIVFVGGSRVLFRALVEWLRPRSEVRRRVLIYGAGDGGVLALRELQNNAKLSRTPIGFVDDDRSKVHSVVRGVPVLCGINRLEIVVRKHKISEIVLAASLSPGNQAQLERVCQETDVPIVRATMRLE